MPKFKVGDVCIGQNFNEDIELNGMECTVTEPKQRRFVTFKFGDSAEDNYYGVTWKNGRHSWCVENKLKRIDPEPQRGDMDTVVSWDECGWNPHKQPIEA